ncbi:MAG: NADPH-dependent FMN reductase [Thermoleophilia bacterium]
MRVLGISGSLRRGSHNTALLRAAADLTDGDVEVEVWDGLREVPPFDEDDEAGEAPAAVARLRAAVAAADAVLVVTPEYNSSVPGQLKNALDWLSRPVATNALRNVPVAAIGASTGAFGAVWSQAELRKVLAAIGARVLERELPVAFAHSRFDEAGRLVDDELREQLREVLAELAAAARERRPAPATAG